jgi:trans-2,3-dihydro-3-hydroxyanthranilate isomerase
MRYRFLITDVFADVAFGGNQLAVLPSAMGLSDAEMQQLAREFGFAETSFVLPPRHAAATHRVRIFTPRCELPFAGHPTVGTAAVLLSLEAEDAAASSHRRYTFEEGVGNLSVETDRVPTGIHAAFTLSVADVALEWPSAPPATAAAAALSLPVSEVREVFFASVGVPFCFVHLTSPEAVDRAVLERVSWSTHFEHAWSPNVFFFAGDTTSGSRLYARMFAPAFGIGEDPATGSAAAALACRLAQVTPSAEGEYVWRIDQGVVMGRPSHIEARATKRGGRVAAVVIAGHAVVVADGSIDVPR